MEPALLRTQVEAWMASKAGEVPKWTQEDEASLGGERRAIVQNALSLMELARQRRREGILDPEAVIFSVYQATISVKIDGVETEVPLQGLYARFLAPDFIQQKLPAKQDDLEYPLQVWQTVDVSVIEHPTELACDITTTFTVETTDPSIPYHEDHTVSHRLNEFSTLEVLNWDQSASAPLPRYPSPELGRLQDQIATQGWGSVFQGMNLTIAEVRQMLESGNFPGYPPTSATLTDAVQ